MDESVEFKSIERHIFEYLSKLIEQKNASQLQKFDSGFKSTYQLENTMRIALEAIKKQSISGSTTSKRKKDSQALIAWSSINWPNLLLPIVNFLISNGTISFRDKQSIYLDQFFVFNDTIRIGSFDWVNNCENDGGARTSFVEKYSKLANSSSKSNRVKRRFEAESEATFVDTIAETEDSINNSMNKSRKMIQSSSNPFSEKLDSFINLLKSEKKNSSLLKTRLDNVVLGEEKAEEKKRATSDENSKPLDIISSFELFFSRLNEEKSKNEKFNEKLLKLISNS